MLLEKSIDLCAANLTISEGQDSLLNHSTDVLRELLSHGGVDLLVDLLLSGLIALDSLILLELRLLLVLSLHLLDALTEQGDNLGIFLLATSVFHLSKTLICLINVVYSVLDGILFLFRILRLLCGLG